MLGHPAAGEQAGSLPLVPTENLCLACRVSGCVPPIFNYLIFLTQYSKIYSILLSKVTSTSKGDQPYCYFSLGQWLQLSQLQNVWCRVSEPPDKGDWPPWYHVLAGKRLSFSSDCRYSSTWRIEIISEGQFGNANFRKLVIIHLFFFFKVLFLSNLCT